MRARLEVAGYALLVPAPLVFAARALMTATDGPQPPGAALAVVGILSGLGMLCLLGATWRTDAFTKVLLGVLVAMLGHYVVADLVDGDLGGAMVYLGTAMLAARHRPMAIYAGLVAAAGALLRSSSVADFGQGLLAAGAIALAVFLIMTVTGLARGLRAPAGDGRPKGA